VNVFAPLVQGASFVQTLMPDTLTLEIARMGGYHTCEFTVHGNDAELTEWLQHGLGRHITITSSSGEVAWEGYVESIQAAIGAVGITVGRLTGVGNHVRAMYSPLATGTIPPTSGARTITAVATDTDSISKYGRWERIVSAGTVTSTEAIRIRDMALTMSAWPGIQHSLDGRVEPGTITVSCCGYTEWLRAYVYEYTTRADLIAVSKKLQRVIRADPNSIFASDLSQIEANNLPVCEYEHDYQSAKVLVDKIVGAGGTALLPYSFGLLPGRVVYYRECPKEIMYFYDPGNKQVYHLSGERVPGWRVLPGTWMSVLGCPRLPSASGSPINTGAIFIESVRYSLPETVSFNGANSDSLKLLLAQLALGRTT